VHELMNWVRSGDYNRIVGGEYPRRDEPQRPPAKEAADAAAHYSDVFKGAFKEAGEHVSTAGHQISDWLRNLQDSASTSKTSEPDDSEPGSSDPPSEPEPK